MTSETELDALIHRTRFSQFVSAGAIGMAIETVIVAILTGFLGISPLIARAAGAETSIPTMFVINSALHVELGA